MSEFIKKIQNNQKTQKSLELILQSYSHPSYKTQSRLGQKSLVRRRIYE